MECMYMDIIFSSNSARYVDITSVIIKMFNFFQLHDLRSDVRYTRGHKWLTSDFFVLSNLGWQHNWNRVKRGSTYLNVSEVPTKIWKKKKKNLSAIYVLDCTTFSGLQCGDDLENGDEEVRIYVVNFKSCILSLCSTFRRQAEPSDGKSGPGNPTHRGQAWHRLLQGSKRH